MAKIEKLKPEQEADLPRFCDEWLKVGLSTDRVDRARSTAAVKALYAAAGEDEPEVWHFDSPAQCIIAINLLRKSEAANLRANLGANLWANLADNLRANLRANLVANLGANLWDNLFVDTWFWGGQDAPWLAFYDFGRRIGVRYEKTSHLDAYIEYASSSGWMYAYKGIAFVSDRPSIIRKDAETRLHCETGPALAFADGYAIHMWHGTEVPAAWIEARAAVSAKDVLSHADGNVRAAGIQILGWARIADDIGAKVIDRHPEGMAGGELLSAEKSRIMPGETGMMKLLRAACPRNGTICFRVPDDTKTAHEAQAWSRGLPPEIFQLPAIRT